MTDECTTGVYVEGLCQPVGTNTDDEYPPEPCMVDLTCTPTTPPTTVVTVAAAPPTPIMLPATGSESVVAILGTVCIALGALAIRISRH